MHRTDTVEISGTAKWRVHLVSVVEERVVDLVLAGLLAERDDGLEPMTPQDFRW